MFALRTLAQPKRLKLAAEVMRTDTSLSRTYSQSMQTK